MYWEHANCCMYVRCVSGLAFTMSVLFFGTIECSSRKQQTLSSGPAVLSPCPLVACCWMFMVMLSFYSRTRGSGNQASCVGLSRTTLTTTSAPPLGKWQDSVFLFWHRFFRQIFPTPPMRIDLNSRNFRLFLYKFFFLVNLLPLERQDHFSWLSRPWLWRAGCLYLRMGDGVCWQLLMCGLIACL